MAVSVEVPTILRTYTGDQKRVAADGSTLREVIVDLELSFPGIKERLVEDDSLRKFINVYINDEDVRFTGAMESSVDDGDVVTILPAVAGGALPEQPASIEL